MTTGIFITARLGSSRLPGKHLLRAGEKTFLDWMILRFKNEFKTELDAQKVRIVIVTGNPRDNSAFEDHFLDDAHVSVFYGSDHNIPERHLACAEKFGFTYVMSVDGDDILCSTYAARCVFSLLNKYCKADYITQSGLPIGMNLSAYKRDFLVSRKDLFLNNHFETGWNRIFDTSIKHEIVIGSHSVFDKKYRLTLDYSEDAAFFKQTIEAAGEEIVTMDDESLLQIIDANNLQTINNGLYDVYWENYNSLKDDENK